MRYRKNPAPAIPVAAVACIAAGTPTAVATAPIESAPTTFPTSPTLVLSASACVLVAGVVWSMRYGPTVDIRRLKNAVLAIPSVQNLQPSPQSISAYRSCSTRAVERGVTSAYLGPVTGIRGERAQPRKLGALKAGGSAPDRRASPPAWRRAAYRRLLTSSVGIGVSDTLGGSGVGLGGEGTAHHV